jgi:hypothetical protein
MRTTVVMSQGINNLWMVLLTGATAAGLGAATAVSPMAVVAALGAAGALGAWALFARHSSHLLSASLLLFIAGLTLPTAAAVGATALLAAFVVLQTFQAAQEGRDAWLVGALALFVVGLWLANGLVNPNTPDMGVALLGVRKTTTVMLGLAAGALWPQATSRRADDVIVGVLIAGGLASLAVHFVAPAYEAGLRRAGDEYTSLFAGSIRMQGIFAGPFHIAVLGSFLVLRGWHMWLSRAYPVYLAATCGALGGVLVFEADVRTAFLTIGAGVLLTVAIRPPSAVARSGVLMRTAVVLVVVGAVLGAGLFSNAAVSSIPQLSQDNRATTRLALWKQGAEYFLESPVLGKGPGSAGATLASDFASGQHVTADNEFIAVLVEGGVVGVVAVILLAGAVARRSIGIFDPSHPAAAAAFSLFGFALTGNVFEALPISLLLAMLVGLRARTPGAATMSPATVSVPAGSLPHSSGPVAPVPR